MALEKDLSIHSFRARPSPVSQVCLLWPSTRAFEKKKKPYDAPARGFSPYNNPYNNKAHVTLQRCPKLTGPVIEVRWYVPYR